MNARWYDSQIGRFVSADTIIPETNNPQSYNRFSYVYNNPLNLTDPSGHNPCAPGPGYYECTRNFYGLEQPEASLSEANEIFEDMADESDIPFAFPADGCYGRAHRMIERTADRYDIAIDSIKKVSIEGHLVIETEYVYEEWNDETVEWGWHVAPLLDVEMDDGRVVPMVIDPSLFDEPVTIETWAAAMDDPNAIITIRDRHWFTPGQKTQQGLDPQNLDDETAAAITDYKLAQYLAYCKDAGYCE